MTPDRDHDTILPDEDQEEGEISDNEETKEDGQPTGDNREVDTEVSTETNTEANAEVPSLQRIASLDDIATRITPGSRNRVEYSKRDGRESLGRDEEENPWLRDTVPYRPPATSYAPNLYNFAWAQAVQGRKSFTLGESPTEDEDGDDEAKALRRIEEGFAEVERDEWQGELPESMEEMTLGVPEGYDIRQRLVANRRLGMWTAGREETVQAQIERRRMEEKEDLEARRRFEREERAGNQRRERNPSIVRRRDKRISSRRDDGEADREKERGGVERGRGGGQRLRERKRQRGKRRGNLHRPASSENSLQSRGSDPSALKAATQFENDYHNIFEVREDGEIEEGEIELPAQKANSRSPSREKSEDHRTEELSVERLPNGDAQDSDEGVIFSGRPKYHSRSMSRGESSFRRLSEDDLRHRLTRDGNRDKSRELGRREHIAIVASLVKNVTVKDAQKSFISTCRHLDNAMRLLEELAKERNASHPDGLPRDVSKLAEKVFQGLRALYAVWNTASGREQERDKDTFPRLLELVNGSCLKLFTLKQGREDETNGQIFVSKGDDDLHLCQMRAGADVFSWELREFMEQVTKASRKPRSLDMQIQPIPKPTVSQEDEVRHGEQSGITVSLVTTVRTTRPPDTVVDVKSPVKRATLSSFTDTKEEADAAAIAAAAVAYAQSSAAAFANIPHGSTYSDPLNGHHTVDQNNWGWNSLTEHEQSMSPGLPPGYSGTAHGARVFNAPGNPGQLNGVINSQADNAKSNYAAHSGWMVQLAANGIKGPLEISRGHQGSHNLIRPAGIEKAGFLEEDWEEFSPPKVGTSTYPATVRRVVTLDARGYSVTRAETAVINVPHNKKPIVPTSAAFRLPSPTPSDENDDDEKEAVQPPDLAVSNPPLLGQKPFHAAFAKTSKCSSTMQPFYRTLNTYVDETSRVQYASAPLGSPTPVEQDSIPPLNFEQSSSEPVSVQTLASLRIRDPRRQLQNEFMINHMQHLSAQSSHSWSLSTARKREGEYNTDGYDPSKRLKMSQPINRMAASELSAGTSAMGGWLEDSTVVYPIQDTDRIEEMEIDSEGPAAAEGGQHTDTAIAGIRDSKIGTKELVATKVGSPMRPEVDEKMGEGASGVRVLDVNFEGRVASQTVAITSGIAFEAGDSAKLRMRPRDPRRALIDSSPDNSDGILGDFMMKNNPVLGAPPQPKRSSPLPASVPPTQYLPQHSTKNFRYAKNQLEVPSSLNGANSSSGATLATSPASQSTTESGHTPSFPLAEKINSSTNSRESGKSGNHNSVKEDPGNSGEATTGSKYEKSGPVKLLSRKPLSEPSLWGGNEVHPDMEQLLGSLDEAGRLAVQKERKRRMEEQDRMFSAGKLCLVLDLDHTLLNSAKFVEIEREWETRLRAAENAERGRASRERHMQRELYRFPHMGMWTKLRPGIWNFLAKASQLYELHVYTMGNKAYATEMAKLLDPTGTLFAERVISKGDEADVLDSDDKPPKSKDLDGVLGMESAVVIIDDSSRVWPHHRENLIVVERYMYFPCSRRQFGLPGPSLLEVGHDERSADGMLASVLAVIDRIHENFFNNQRLREVDVRAILAAEQRRVLAGCCVLFSRIFPVGEAAPHMHPLWRMAEQFGAACCLNINEKVTHVVAISLGTDKVNWASATGRPVVRPAWLEASAILYRRANEQDFPVPP